MSGGDNMDFCEYVYNPLMRHYQAMMRLMQMMRDSQSADCNDVQCFTSSNDPTNPMNSLSGGGGAAAGSMSFLTTYGPMLVVWALFVFALFMFRPNSMRERPRDSSKKGGPSQGVPNNRFPNSRDDDDDSAVF